MTTLYIKAPAGRTYILKNVTDNTRSYITPNLYDTVTQKYILSATSFENDTANRLKYGENTLQLLASEEIVARAIASAECVTGTKWNGEVCVNVVTSVPRPTIVINRTPRVLNIGQNMTVSWSTTNATSLSYYCI
jgi:hypothetical protein